MQRYDLNVLGSSLLHLLGFALLKSLIIWLLYCLVVPTPLAFLPALKYTEMFIIVMIYEFFITTLYQQKMLVYLENINFVANSVYLKDKAVQAMLNSLMKSKDGIAVTEIKNKNDVENKED